MATIATTLGNDHMALFGKLTATLGCAALAFSLPMLAAATQSDDTVEATHFVSSGRIVNVVADVTPDAQAEARAAIWALTETSVAPTCETTGASDASCFDTFHAGNQ